MLLHLQDPSVPELIRGLWRSWLLWNKVILMFCYMLNSCLSCLNLSVYLLEFQVCQTPC
jgi:hypothetical protein